MSRNTRSKTNFLEARPTTTFSRVASTTQLAGQGIVLRKRSFEEKGIKPEVEVAVKRAKIEPGAYTPKARKVSQSPTTTLGAKEVPDHNKPEDRLVEAKWRAWSKHAHTSPFEDFSSPTEQECRKAYSVLEQLHDETMRRDFEYIEDPEKGWPHVMQALIVATLSQATSWNNAKRALKSMTDTYGSPFAYQEILDGGEEQLKDALRPGGMQNRKSKMVMQILVDVKTRHGKWDLDHLFTVSDEEAVKELISYKGVGPKSAFCILSICLHRKSFAVDTHIYRITGMWGWRPTSASKEMAQAHLDARIPDELKLSMHNLLIVHGRTCPVCRGNGNAKARCEFQALLEKGGCV